MSEPKPEQRKLSSAYVIVYDPITFAVTLEKAEKFRDYIEDPDSLLKIAPKLGSYVDLYEGVSMIAQIKLGQLGWAANTKRLFGKCNQIVIR